MALWLCHCPFIPSVPVIRACVQCSLNAVTTFACRVGYLAVPYVWYFFPRKRRYIVFLVCACFVTGCRVLYCTYLVMDETSCFLFLCCKGRDVWIQMCLSSYLILSTHPVVSTNYINARRSPCKVFVILVWFLSKSYKLLVALHY